MRNGCSILTTRSRLQLQPNKPKIAANRIKGKFINISLIWIHAQKNDKDDDANDVFIADPTNNNRG